jgi:hypothetical protein
VVVEGVVSFGFGRGWSWSPPDASLSLSLFFRRTERRSDENPFVNTDFAVLLKFSIADVRSGSSRSMRVTGSTLTLTNRVENRYCSPWMSYRGR